ncbi:MAG: substrate-binding domain-containing protein [Oscillospiraceae bacterium]|nr:substrate-binding domain-containing protein [Oscillospiraceae bacterium]
MVESFFSNLSLPAQEQLLLQEEILSGAYGKPGELFLTTRTLSEQRHISVVTAHNVLNGLCEAGYLELKGKKYYLAYGSILEKKHCEALLIGLLIPQLNNEFYSSLSNAIVEEAGKRGYQTVLISTSYSPEEERKAIETLTRLKVAGIVSCVPIAKKNEYLYRDSNIPCVILCHEIDKSKISSVQVNSFSISKKVAQNLIEEGYRNFMYVGTEVLPLENDVRFTAFQMELKQHGFSLSDNDTFRLGTDTKKENPALIQRLSDQKEPIGIFCYHDLIAVQIYRICRKIDKRIPYDVGVIGFDDLSVATALYPPLTTVQYRITTISDMALNLLISKIKSPKAPYDHYYIEPNLVVRRSTLLSKEQKE